MKLIIFLFGLLINFSASAETYPATFRLVSSVDTYEEQQTWCNSAFSFHWIYPIPNPADNNYIYCAQQDGTIAAGGRLPYSWQCDAGDSFPDPATNLCTRSAPAPAPCPAAGTAKGAGTEAYIDRLSLDVCQSGCGFTASGAMNPHRDDGKMVAFGPFIATGQTCTPSGGTGSNTSSASVPDSQCSYRNPSTGVCEASCPSGWEYKLVPTGAMACVKPAIDTNPTPTDTSCPRGYMNISITATPNCAPTGGLGNMSSSGPATCPAGQHSTSLNGGAAYCVFDAADNAGSATSKTASPVATITNSDGSTTATQTETISNKDGSTTTKTTTTTTGTDGSQSISEKYTTTKTPGGKDGVPDGDKTGDLCKSNPSLNICNNSTVSGTGANTACTGDAIQCATLQRLSKFADDTPTAQSTLGNDVLAGNDPSASTLPSASNGTTIAMPSSLDSTGFLGAGSCFPDKQFTIQGHTITISFTDACQPLLVFRYVIFVIALLVSLSVLGGAMIKN